MCVIVRGIVLSIVIVLGTSNDSRDHYVRHGRRDYNLNPRFVKRQRSDDNGSRVCFFSLRIPRSGDGTYKTSPLSPFSKTRRVMSPTIILSRHRRVIRCGRIRHTIVLFNFSVGKRFADVIENTLVRVCTPRATYRDSSDP